MPRCYYEVLSIPQNADEAAIKKAYRVQALQWHPGGSWSATNSALEADTMLHDLL